MSYMHRTLETFRELKRKGDQYLRNFSEIGVNGIHLCGEDDLTEILSFCFTGYKINLLSVISEKILLNEVEKNKDPKFPVLESDELIMITSLDNQELIEKLLINQGFIKNEHWIIFS